MGIYYYKMVFLKLQNGYFFQKVGTYDKNGSFLLQNGP